MEGGGGKKDEMNKDGKDLWVGLRRSAFWISRLEI